jgi:site-specific DNA-methyltransferase (adenine-specific)/modification methylase
MWKTELGQVWIVGRHRLMCRDATKDSRPDGTLITDPPYGINRDPGWLDNVDRTRKALSSRDVLRGDDGTLDLTWLQTYPARCVWGFPYISDAGATGWLVWDKQPGVESRGIVTPIEMAATTLRSGFDMIRCMWGGYYRDKDEDSQPHPTQKPVKVMAACITMAKQEPIVDPFLGSGTTMVAAEQLDRVCYGMEIEPKYVAVALQRMKDLGLEPRLEK